MTKILVGIVAYNTPIDILRKTIESTAASDCQIDLVLVCNSPDESYQAAVGAMRIPNFNFKIVRTPNEGFGAGHNHIVKQHRQTGHQWYICCNPDIEFQTSCISRLVDFSEKTADAIVVGPKILNLDGSIQPLSRKNISIFNWLGRQLWRAFPRIFEPYELKFDYSKTQEIEFVSGSIFCISIANYLKLDGFSSDFFLYFEDADLSYRAQALGRNYYLSQAQVSHAWGKAWSTSGKAFKVQFSAMLIYFRKNGYFGGRNRRTLA